MFAHFEYISNYMSIELQNLVSLLFCIALQEINEMEHIRHFRLAKYYIEINTFDT